MTYFYVQSQIHGSPVIWEYSFETDKKMFHSKEACYAHAVKILGHDDFYIVQVKWGKIYKFFNGSDMQPSVVNIEMVEAIREQISL